MECVLEVEWVTFMPLVMGTNWLSSMGGGAGGTLPEAVPPLETFAPLKFGPKTIE